MWSNWKMVHVGYHESSSQGAENYNFKEFFKGGAGIGHQIMNSIQIRN